MSLLLSDKIKLDAFRASKKSESVTYSNVETEKTSIAFEQRTLWVNVPERGINQSFIVVLKRVPQNFNPITGEIIPAVVETRLLEGMLFIDQVAQIELLKITCDVMVGKNIPTNEFRAKAIQPTIQPKQISKTSETETV